MIYHNKVSVRKNQYGTIDNADESASFFLFIIDEAFKKCQKTGGTSKQAMAIANIILADEICMSADIYGCNGIADLPKATLNPEDFDKFIKKANDVSENERCYDYIMSSVSMNETKFEEDAFPVRWGAMVEAQNEVMIIDVQLRKLCQDGGYNCNNFIDWLDEHGLLRYTNKNKRTVQISGAVMKTRPRCYAIKLQRTAN